MWITYAHMLMVVKQLVYGSGNQCCTVRCRPLPGTGAQLQRGLPAEPTDTGSSCTAHPAHAVGVPYTGTEQPYHSGLIQV